MPNFMTAEYLNTREQFGVKIASFQALQHIFADMVTAEEEIKSLAWLVANSANMKDANEHERLVRVAKARTGALGIAMAESAVQLHGGIGVTNEFIISHYLRRMIALDLSFGDSEQQLLYLAERY